MTENKTTEQVIIESARQIFIEKGYSEANMTDIAQRAGINRPALHYYFRTKERMLDAVYEDIVRSFMPKVVQLLTDRNTPLFERMEKVVDIYYDILLEKPNLPMFGLREIYRDADHLFETAIKVSDGQVEMIREMFIGEMKEGRIKTMPLEFVIYSFYGLLFAPFAFHPLVKLMTDVPDPLNKEYLAKWKTNIISQMRTLLEVKC